MAAAAAAAAGGCGGAAGAMMAAATMRGAEIVDEHGVPIPADAVAGWVPSVEGPRKLGKTISLEGVAALGKALVAAIGVPDKSYFEPKPTRIVNRYAVCSEWFAEAGSEREGVVVEALKAFFVALREHLLDGAPVDWFPAGYSVLTSVKPDGTIFDRHGYKTTIPAEACWGWADELATAEAAAAAAAPAPFKLEVESQADLKKKAEERRLLDKDKLTAKQLRTLEELTAAADAGAAPAPPKKYTAKEQRILEAELKRERELKALLEESKAEREAALTAHVADATRVDTPPPAPAAVLEPVACGPIPTVDEALRAAAGVDEGAAGVAEVLAAYKELVT